MSFFQSNVFKVIVGGCVFVIPAVATFVEVVGYVAKVEGSSMQDTLNPKKTTDYVFLRKSRKLINKKALRHGDIVSLVSPRNPDQTIIKRIIAMEGDIVKFPESTKISPYWDNPKGSLNMANRTLKIPTGHIWVEGDNSSQSIDSNFFGPVSSNFIMGKATHLVWPNFVPLPPYENDPNRVTLATQKSNNV